MAGRTAARVHARPLTRDLPSAQRPGARGAAGQPGAAHVEGASASHTRQDSAGARAARLDAVIHERMRLGIVSALAVNDALSFADLKRVLGTTDGNLSVHARRLEEAGYVACSKRFEGRVPRTEYRLTAAGRRALERYLQHMEALIRATRNG